MIIPSNCRVVLHTAPNSPVTCNNKHKSNSWFDIYSLDGKEKTYSIDLIYNDYD